MKNAYRKWFARKLREQRELNGVSVRAIARALEMKRTTYIAYEDGRAEPSIYTLERLCKLYEINISDFLKDSPLSKIL